MLTSSVHHASVICPGDDMVDRSPEGYLHQFEELGTACIAYGVTFEPTVHEILQA